MASELLMAISKDEDERARFRSRRKFESDLESNMLTAVYNAKMDVAKKMLARGTDVEIIAEDTGLTVDEILKLK